MNIVAKSAGTGFAAVVLVATGFTAHADAATTSAWDAPGSIMQVATAPTWQLTTSADKCKPWMQGCGPMAKAYPSKKSKGSCNGYYDESCGATWSPTGESYGPMAYCSYNPRYCQ